MNASDIQPWLLILGGGSIYGTLQLWSKVFSSRVKLQTDLRLLKMAREAGIDVAEMELGIKKRIHSMYNPGKQDDEKKAKDDQGISGNLFLALMSFGILWACIQVVIEEIKKPESRGDAGIGGIIFMSLVALLFAFGLFAGIRDALIQIRVRLNQWRYTRKTRGNTST